jgi:RNA polymerase sigma factor (sigma-70 family)
VIWQAVGELDAREQTIIDQFARADMSFPDIADGLGVHRSTVNRAVKTLMQKLKYRLEEYEGNSADGAGSP